MRAANTPLGSRRALRIGPETLRRVGAPTLLVWGADDPFGPVEAARAIQRALPQAALTIVPGAGHLPWFDNPAACAHQVATFLTALPGAPGASGYR
ncbi:MAG: alpha/beta hydrolase [Bifidobacteriaceae bacterium]|jgi:pimeloyl-ACP methyl ester carboxylesterase|nr:alpha/beta hydrolase [Bifidobacteriaceae bacterium]